MLFGCCRVEAGERVPGTIQQLRRARPGAESGDEEERCRLVRSQRASLASDPSFLGGGDRGKTCAPAVRAQGWERID